MCVCPSNCLYLSIIFGLQCKDLNNKTKKKTQFANAFKEIFTLKQQHNNNHNSNNKIKIVLKNTHVFIYGYSVEQK